MELSNREIQLTESLLRHPEGITADGLAERLGVSARTVHRDLGAVSEFLGSRGITLVRRSGVGVKLEDPDGIREDTLQELSNARSPERTPPERRLYLLRRLLVSGEPVKLRALASELKVAVGTVGRDLDELEVWLEGFGLSLLRRPGYGVQVRGRETDLRRALSHLVLSGPETEPRAGGSGESPILESVSDRLLGVIDEDRLRRVEELTTRLVGRLPYAIADSAFVGLSVHVALMVERLLRGGEIELDPAAIERLEQTTEYRYAGTLAREVEQEFEVTVPAEEVGYITTHLRGAKLRQDDSLQPYFGSLDLDVASRVKALIHYVESQTGVGLVGDGSLYAGLLAHLERAIYRLREKLGISNPLLTEVKEDYPALFDLVARGLGESFVEDIPEEEVGFVAMHFGAALDRGKGSFPQRVLAICPAGIGSAKMLASRLEREFPQIRTIKNASLFELKDLDPAGFDLVVSTVPLPLPDDAYVRVQPFLSEAEADSIREHLRGRSLESRIQNRSQRAVSESLEVFGGGEIRFHQMAEATQAIAELIDDFFLRSHEAGGSVARAVRLMCASLAGKGLVSDAARLEEGLISRMQVGGVGIPGTSLALFHARSDAVYRSAFSVHVFEEPLELEGMDGAPMRVSRSLLMLAPVELSPVVLEAISEISVAMVERPGEREALENGSEPQITAVLENIFGRFLRDKLS